MKINLFLITIFSFFLTYCCTYLLIPYLKKYSLQKPNIRGSHFTSKPSGGGIAFALIISFFTFFLDKKISLICLPLAFVGFLDDLFNLKKNVRYFAQVFTAILIIYENQFIQSYLQELNLILYMALFLFLIICITGIINFTNFMDGIDGLISSCFLIVFSVAAIKVDPSLWIIVGTLSGFLFWNWYPAKVFMGDVGSTFLGALLSAVLLKAKLYDCLMLIAVSLPIFLDAFVCLIRRFNLNQPIFKAHSLHLYQRLFQAGWSHSKISLIYLVSTLILSLCVLNNMKILIIPILIIIVSFGIFLDRYVAVPFKESLEKCQ